MNIRYRYSVAARKGQTYFLGSHFILEKLYYVTQYLLTAVQHIGCRNLISGNSRKNYQIYMQHSDKNSCDNLE